MISARWEWRPAHPCHPQLVDLGIDDLLYPVERIAFSDQFPEVFEFELDTDIGKTPLCRTRISKTVRVGRNAVGNDPKVVDAVRDGRGKPARLNCPTHDFSTMGVATGPSLPSAIG